MFESDNTNNFLAGNRPPNAPMLENFQARRTDADFASQRLSAPHSTQHARGAIINNETSRANRASAEGFLLNLFARQFLTFVQLL